MAEVQAPLLSKTEGDASQNSKSNAPNPRMRKRTKTGCLTCRKRRIKCGEEKPVCANCIKSKRHCEGYNQRVVFKPPIDNWPGNAGIHTLQYHTGGMPGTALRGFRAQQPMAAPDGSQAPSMAAQRAPANIGFPQDVMMQHAHASGPPMAAQPFSEPFAAGPAAQPQPYQAILLRAPGPHPGGLNALFPFPAQFQTPGSGVPNDQQHGTLSSSNNDFSHPSAIWNAPPQMPSMEGIQEHPELFAGHTQGQQMGAATVPVASNPRFLAQASIATTQPPQSLDQSFPYQTTQSRYAAQQQLPTASNQRLDQETFNAIANWQSNLFIPAPQPDSLSPPIHGAFFQNQLPTPQTTPDSRTSVDGSVQTAMTSPMDGSGQQSHALAIPADGIDSQPVSASWYPRNIAQNLLEAGAIELQDDDYYDIISEEEDAIAHTSNQDADFGQLVALHKESVSDFAMRTYDAFLTPNLLERYQPERAANPLRNEATRRIFAHFIHATGPSLSIYERNPRNSSALFSDVQIPRSQQNIWTYTLPLLAIKDQALLQVMLALGSLHIAKLQDASEMPSLKHYGYAIKRINKRLSDESKRHQVTTLAASLLLGFYEVMTAEHMKWSTHLQGAQRLIVEIDYAGMTKLMRQRRREEQFYGHNPQLPLIHGHSIHDRNEDVDEGLISTLIGREVRYDDFGQVVSDGHGRSNGRRPFDLDDYDIYQDLFWWYCRQDAYQSMISGERLLMPYHRWSDCTPRAKMGGTAVYGAHDHLILLLGRITDFAARDRPRKARQLQAFGPQWKMPGPPGGRPGQGPPMGPPGGPPAAGPPMGPPGGPPAAGPPMGPPGGPPAAGPPMGPPGGPPAAGPPMGPPGGPPAAGPPMGPPGGPPAAGPPMGPTGMHQSPNSSRGPSEGPYRGPPGGPPAGMGPPGFGGPPNGPPNEPPNGPPGGPPGGPPPGMAAPSFYGMAPIVKGHMPAAYQSVEHRRRRSSRFPHGDPSSPSATSERSHASTTSSKRARDIADLPAATASALEEWKNILHALTVFERHLGPHLQPLSPDCAPNHETPFGPAMQYRSFDIAVLWGLYHMGHLILHRAHPTMPPAAMMAAAVSAHQTAQRAQEIGRIAAGIVDVAGGMAGLNPTEATQIAGAALNPSLGAALYEITLPLFFAGVQFMAPHQREWLIDRVLMVQKQTGFQSAGAIAMGCETAWENAALRGGPPYKRRDPRTFKVAPRATLKDYKRPKAASSQRSSPQATSGQLHAVADTSAHGPGGHPSQMPEPILDPLEKLKLDRGSVHTNPTARIHYAMGLLSIDDDYEKEDGEEDDEETGTFTIPPFQGPPGGQEQGQWPSNGMPQGYQGFPNQC